MWRTVVLCAGIGGLAVFGRVDALQKEFLLSADDAFEKGMEVSGVQKNLKGKEVLLADHVVIEDDGPGIGSSSQYLQRESDRSPVFVLGGQRLAKKVLRVDRPEALEARLFGVKGTNVEVNGVKVEIPPDTSYPKIPVNLLKKGDNIVVLSAPGVATGPAIKVAVRDHIIENAPERKDAPCRSFTSTDGGKSWQPVDGELMVRLFLRQYPQEGSYVSPVFDLCRDEATPALSSGAGRIVRLSVEHEAEIPGGTSVLFLLRTGSTPVYDPSSWSGWSTPPLRQAPAGHRFAQWKAVLRTSDPTQTPRLSSVKLVADVARSELPDWTKGVCVRDYRNEEIRYTSIPFTYENPAHPKLVSLREKYKLDEVVASGKSEFEKLVLLRNWVSKQWKFKPPSEGYPAWDAHEILERKIGFCVQYAITYIQCCEALGHQARFVFGYHPVVDPGHEVTEVWSNEYRKWVCMDPSGNRHHVDPATGQPLSMLEVHDRMVRSFYGEKEALWQNRPQKPLLAPDIATCAGTNLQPQPLPQPLTTDRWPPYSKWLSLRWMPRNDFYTRPVPLPRIQGWNWDWTGYWYWYDAQTPVDYKYPNVTCRRSDIDWTINQVRFDASAGRDAGQLTVRMGTVTPNFSTFLVNVNGQGWKPSDASFVWTLREGVNRLEMRVRNTAGVEGPVSVLELEYRRQG